jgi:hypothetical protein
MRYWERVRWDWVAVVGLALCFIGFVLYGVPSARAAALPIFSVGIMFLMVVGLSTSRLAVKRVPTQSRLQLPSTWAWRTAAAGPVLILAAYLMRVTHLGRPAASYLVLAGLGFFVIGLSVCGLAFIRLARGSERLSLLWAWRVGILGGLSVWAGAAISLLGGAHILGEGISAAGLAIICFSYLVYHSIDLAASLSRATSWTTTWLLILLFMGFIFLFPPFVIFLATNGNGVLFPASQNLGVVVCSALLLGSIPSLLVGLPEILRRRLPWDQVSDSGQASDLAKKVLLSWLAVAAALATALYVLLLHFFDGPLASVAIGPLCAALLAVLALLTPFYKLIAAACFERGVMDIVHLTHWRASQVLMLRKLRTAWRAPNRPNSKLSIYQVERDTEGDPGNLEVPVELP